MVATAVADKLAESDDLDWKQALPNFARTPGVWNEFAKDVAAMANTRGGLLIYGVSDRIELVGIDLSTVDKKQLLSTMRNVIQPYISEVDFLELTAPGGNGPDILVVDIPPSEMAPHFQYGWESRDKDRATFNAPYRIRDDTYYMTEHQVARAYQDRFARQAATHALLKEHLADATDVVLSESDHAHAWLVIATQLTRPVPHLVPATTQEEAESALRLTHETAVRISGNPDRSAPVATRLTQVRVGLRRWIASNLLTPNRRTPTRGILVELHHDGTVIVCADLSANLAAGDHTAVDTRVLRIVALEAVVLADIHRLHRAPDTAVEITATIATAATDRRLTPFELDFGSMELVDGARHPKRLLPSSTELAPNADDDTLRECAHELASGPGGGLGCGRDAPVGTVDGRWPRRPVLPRPGAGCPILAHRRHMAGSRGGLRVMMATRGACRNSAHNQ
ncbi:AlbA family DNA-binding domain-containing protein [Streptomyces prunicolor]|uniref:AlbA family DNA-binding domain-containing protein n=1 Tax=Streptomyces prunicolor TaxID=67348 RepID=UPI00037CBA08|nr:ATP-binding protein [Streptomyces prunicolor]